MNQLLRRRLGRLLALACAIAAVCLWKIPRDTKAPQTVPAGLPALSATLGGRSTNSPLPAAAAWNRWRDQLPAAKPAIEDVTEWPAGRSTAFDQFREWQARYQAAGAADRPGLEAEGVALARARRTAMARWIERDPEFALMQAVGPDARRLLPAAVLAELERWIEGRGAHEVTVRCGPEVKPADQTTRIVRVGGEEFRAFAYGGRLGLVTKYDLPIHAVAVDGKLALHSSPVRQLEPGEVQARGLNPQAIHLDTGGRVATAASPHDAFAIEANLLQREAGRGPYPASMMPPGEVPAGLPPGTAAFPPSAGWTLGQKRVLIIFVDFSDSPGALMTTNAAATVMSTVQQFYLDNSQSQTSLLPVYFPTTLRLPRTKAAYSNLDPMNDVRADSLTAARAYDAANGNTGAFNPDNYDLDVSVFTSINGANFGFAGLAFVGAKGCVVNGEFDLRVMAHELGHNYGLWHANSWVVSSNPIDPAGTQVDYGDDYDMMGGNNSNVPIHFNEWFKAYLGWLSTSNWRTAPTGGVYRLFRHDHISATGIRGITLGQQSDRAYWLGFRKNLSTYPTSSTNFLANGVEVRWGMQPSGGIGNNMSSTGSRLLNFTPTTANFTRHPLPVGQTFTDSGLNISVTPTGVGGTAPDDYIDLNVTYSTPPVSITQNPLSQTVFAGANVTFTVTATGTAPITYQWTFNGANIPGATSSTLTLNAVTTNQSGSYLAQVTNPGGTINSQTAILTVNPVPQPPSITQQPTNLAVLIGSTATFTVTATGDAPLVYQWFFNNTNSLAGETNSNLVLPNATTNLSGNYRVVITNAVGSVTSVNATLTVGRLSPALGWSAPASVVYGTALSGTQLNATGSVSGTFVYNPPAGTILPAGTNQLTVAFTPDDQVNYLTNAATVNLVVTRAPLTVTADTKGRVYGQANPALTISYSGFVNGETTAVLTTLPTIATTADLTSPPGVYPITISGAVAANYTITHVDGVLAVTALAPIITMQPTNVTAFLTTMASFTVGAGGFPSPAFQWFYNGVAVPDGTNNSLAVAVTTTNQAGNYQVVITNVAGSITSSVAVLTVSRLVPGITWPTPTPVTYGTTLGTAQLNASTAVPGTMAYSPASGTLLPAGTHTLTNVFTPTDQTRYVITTNTVNLVVNPAALTATADSQSRLFGFATQPLTVTYTGFVNSETASVLIAPAVPATVADINSLPGTYPITLSGATAANYAVTHVAGSLTIAANQGPSATFATNNVVVLEDSGPVSVSSFAAFSAGPALESAQTITSITVGNNNPALFAVAPALTSGTLIFTPATNANGVATVTVIAQDDGGTGGGGVDRSTNTFTLTVTAVNDAPGFTVLPAVGPAGAVWTPRESQRAWTAIASSADGSRLAAVVGPETTGKIYVSTNAGLSWAASESDRNWMTVAMSSDGLTVVAAGTSTDIVVSKDGGMTWSHTTAGQRAWQSVATSADGNRLAAAAFNGQLYTSADGGTNWTARSMVTDWAGIASSADGTRLVAVDLDGGAAASYLGGRIHISTDGGTNWTQSGAPAGSWAAVASSGDGTRLTAIQSGGQIFVSTDGGTNWTARDSSRTWQAVASSADGLKLLAVENNGLIYVSTDGGTNWVPRESVRFWSGVASSADGSRVAAVENDGLIYTSTLLLENAGPQSIPQFATALSAGPANESAQVVSFVVTNDNNALFSTQPAVSSVGTLSFTPATNTFGSATVTVVAQDDGGTANGGTNATPLQTFTITVAAVNQPPAVTFATNNVVVFKDSATTTLGGHATFSVGPANESSQTILGFTVANNNNPLFSVQPALDAGGTLTFTPAASAFGTATVTVAVQDSGGTAMGGVDRATNTFTILVSRLVPALTWSTPAAITYGTALGAGQLNASAGAVPGAFAYVPPTGTVLPAGTNLLTANFTPTDTSVYENNSVTVSLVVTQAALTVTADNQTRAFGLANPTLTLSYTGFVNGETVANLTSAASAATAADVNSLPGGYPITASGATGTNYSITHVAGLLTVTAVPPALVLNPTNQTVIAGTDVTHVAAATGGPTPTYQWYFNATNLLAGATNATLLLTSAQSAQQGTYTVVAANVGGSVTSVVASLTVLVPPTISAQPQSRTNNALTDAAFTVTAAGTAPLVYQWYSNTVAVADATNASLTVSNATTAATGNYQVIVTNAAGAVTSSVATLTVDLLTPSVTWATPTPVTYGTVLGAGQLNASTPVAGAFAYSPASGTLLPAGTHTLTNVFTPANPAAYVSTTGTVSLVVNPAVLTATAVSQARLFGVANAPLTVNYTGFVNGETVAVLTTPAVPATVADINSLSGVYPITISGATAPNYTVTHVSGTITVLAPPMISTEPVSRTNNALTDATFSVTATGTAPLVYQWYSNTVAVADATNASLTVSNVMAAAAGNYQVIITNAAGAATSSVVSLTVNLLTPTVTWPTPLPVNYGSLITFTQLNASTPVAGTFAYAPASGTLLPAGTHTLTNVFTPANPAAYVSTTGMVSLVVNPAALTATAVSQTRAFGTPNVPPTVSYAGFVNSETVANLTSAATASTLADINSLPGGYAITASGAAGTNYNITHVAGLLTVTAVPPVLVLSPTNQTVIAGSNATHVAFATGGPAPTYQWYFNTTTALAGATNSTLVVTNPQPAQAGGYTVVAANVGGSVTSAVATLTVLVPPSISVAPVNRTNNALTDATFGVTATGTAPLVYQWYSNTVAVADATNASLTVSNVTTAATGNYQVIITNAAGAATSSVVSLTVDLLTPTVTWPTPAALTYGALLSATQLNASTPVAGTFAYAPASGTLLPAGTHTLTNVFTPANPAAYVSTTGTVNLVVNQAALTATAASQTRAFGTANAPLTVNYSGFVNSETVANLTSAATAATLADINSLPGTYAITVSGAAGTNYNITHVAGLLTVTAVPPVLVLSPTNQTVIAGVDVTHAALATGGPAPTYQWYLNVTNVLANATNATLVVTNVQPAQAGDYTVVAANVGGSVTSAVATLTVLVPPSISVAPVNRTNNALTDATFTVTAAGTAPLVYQWYSNTVAVADATNTSLTVSNVMTAATGNYQVIITNAAGAATSSVVSLTVDLLTPTVTWPTPAALTYGALLSATQLNASTPVAGTFAYAPASGTLLPAGTHTLTNVFTPANPAAYVSTTGTVSLVVNPAALTATAASQTRAFGTPNVPPTVSYSGFVNSETVANLTSAATASTLADLNSLPGGYAITASGAAGANYSITHVAGLLTVTAVPPVLVLSPTNQTVIAGVDVTHAALATGGPAPTYQWYLNVTNVLAGATNSTLVVTNAQLAQAGDYTVVAANVGGSVTSAVATLTVLVPPSISAQPQPIVVLPGSNVLFNVTAGGTAPLAYQWRFNGSPLPGETNAQLAVPNAQALNAGPYSVSVTNAAGGVLSSNAVLSIGSGPTITTQPLDLVSIVGATAVFSVTATGTPAPAFIWQKNGFPLSGETNSSLVITNLLVGHGGPYSVLVSNVFGTAPSSNATLQVIQPVAVTISGQPQNQTATAGATVTFNVTAAGAPPPSYQWLKGVTPIPNANGPALSLTNISLADADGYSVQVFNAVNMVPSATATLTVQVPPVITNQPQSVLTNLGANATFNVGATGLPAPTYQWFKDGLLIAPATGGFVGQASSNLSVLTVQPAQTGTYVVVAANAAGSVTSAPVTLSLVSAPVITVQPTGFALDRTNLIPPAPVLFSVTATGVPPLTYQWRFNGTSLPGATNASLVWTNLARSNSGYFSVQVANPGGATLSSNALLRIRLAQDVVAPIRPAGGGFRIAFGDMDGAGMVASNLSKFEIQFSTNLVDWTPAPSALGLLNGKFILDDAGAGAAPRRYYRVIER